VSDQLGRHTLEEIRAQPDDWGRLLDELPRMANPFAGRPELLLLGCGSQFYLGLSAAWAYSTLVGVRSQAVPASEFIAHPEVHRPRGERALVVLVSRSGRTSEVLEACERAREMGLKTFSLGSSPDAPLAQASHEAVVFPFLEERSVVTTRSTSGFLMALLFWAMELSRKSAGERRLAALPDAARSDIARAEQVTHSLARGLVPRAAAFLGSGPLYGIAHEGALKCNEMALLPTAAFHSLEYRHGPRSLVGQDILAVGLASRSEEMAVLREIKELGGRTLGVLPGQWHEARAEWNLAIDVGTDTIAALPLYLTTVQVLGWSLAQAQGLDPDAPRHLTRYVDLGRAGAV